MAVKIRLVRLGKIRTPHFRIVVADSRKARNGLKIEEIGRYSPASEPSLIEVNSERAQHWLKNGAKPTEAVEALLKITGDWQKFKGTAGSEGTLKTLPARPDKRVAYEAAVKAAMNEPKDGATTMKKRAAEKLAAKTAPAEESPVAQAEEPAPAAEAPATETPAVETPTETAEQ
ncbi:MAG: 30S ribosomal protein S16 [Actinobacteria bacterium]|nr:30S ribosomal protein S16 [Actinomycetota bacterium]NDA39088.1 30S ribosomal protein S16 [Actinomycetota bacterium]NDE12266.1 30S ribosomal protein S16 [Actinomycetota bacterium]NDE83134.1 30S ribosomal protein S16 [Actinomycetota bacterium]